MENLSEILKKKEIPINTSAENTDTWSGGSTEESVEDGRPAEDCPVCRGTRFVHPALPSGESDYSRLVPCVCAKDDINRRRAARLQAISNLGNLSKLTFGNLSPLGRSSDPVSQKLFQLALDEIRKFAENPQGWIVLAGPVGSGKTHLACAVANYRISQGHSAFYITAAELLDHLRSAYSPSSEIEYDELFEQIKNSPLLILDNLNYSATTVWSKGKLEQLLEHRFNGRLPTLITTGMSVEEFATDYAGHMNDPELSKVLILKKESSSLQSLDSLDLELLKNMKFSNFDSKRLSLHEDVRQNLAQAFVNAREFARAPQGWLIYQGVNGCGKTHLAAAIANELRESGKEVLFIVVPDLLDHLRASFAPDSRVSYDALFEKIKKIPVLVLDDFGEHSATSWAQEKLYQIINYRYNARLATVITTCLYLEEIENRVSSRMVDPSISLVFNIMAPDYRGDIKASRTVKPRPRSKN
ncbi:MAG: ATP-binding protein [Dehalococcoidia bacterium]|nr:ATP-binding protein [Dehalococcoidia bacterium]